MFWNFGRARGDMPCAKISVLKNDETNDEYVRGNNVSPKHFFAVRSMWDFSFFPSPVFAASTYTHSTAFLVYGNSIKENVPKQFCFRNISTVEGDDQWTSSCGKTFSGNILKNHWLNLVFREFYWKWKKCLTSPFSWSSFCSDWWV